MSLRAIDPQQCLLLLLSSDRPQKAIKIRGGLEQWRMYVSGKGMKTKDTSCIQTNQIALISLSVTVGKG